MLLELHWYFVNSLSRSLDSFIQSSIDLDIQFTKPVLVGLGKLQPVGWKQNSERFYPVWQAGVEAAISSSCLPQNRVVLIWPTVVERLLTLVYILHSLLGFVILFPSQKLSVLFLYQLNFGLSSQVEKREFSIYPWSENSSPLSVYFNHLVHTTLLFSTLALHWG